MPKTHMKTGTNDDGVAIDGVRGTHSKKRDQRIARRVNKVFELREQGMTMAAIAEACNMTRPTVESILQDPGQVKRRLTTYNEKLRAMTPKALKVVEEVLDSVAPQSLGQRADMARWLLESTKTVGKESPVNIFIKGGDTNITVGNDTLEAARAVAAAMRGEVARKALPVAEVVDGEIISGSPAEDSTGDAGGTVDSEQSGEPLRPDVHLPE
jgi:hypothetical protein